MTDHETRQYFREHPELQGEILKQPPDDPGALLGLARWTSAPIGKPAPARTADTVVPITSRGPDDWPEPLPVNDSLPPVERFHLDVLPPSFRPLVADVADRMQVPQDYVAAIAVLCLAGAVNRRACIQPKEHDHSWIVVPNLWGKIIASSGLLKSPIIREIIGPLVELEADWRADHDDDLKRYGRQLEEAKLRREAWEQLYKQAAKRSNPLPERPEDEPQEPTLPAHHQRRDVGKVA